MFRFSTGIFLVIGFTSISSFSAVLKSYHDRDGVPVLVSDSVAVPKPMSREGRQKYLPLVSIAASEVLLDPALISAVITRESGWQRSAKSNKGALGLMQLMPETARNWGVKDPYDAWENIRAGSRHLKYLVELFDRNIPLALAAYHAGEGLVIRDGTIPSIKETIAYVKAVQDTYDEYARFHSPKK